ncbi:plant UBX domain-containing protein 4 [Prunus yedoensis var. nudiflora]|uniref:Plant UBX domain-containing protein 4 n=1 Tax=Prunus yedoensis var. nudiflora TaxID=2094558 RepID=A0A314UKN5_PRUYE|nr:plant UBX domain-containing protein 4 [Prunus yedoensis var. nudiflora]
METEAQESNPQNDAVINSFCEITSASKQEALFFLESHNWDLDAAVSTFLDNNTVAVSADAPTNAGSYPIPASHSLSPSPSHSPNYSPSQSPPRSRSPSPTPSRAPYQLRSKRAASSGAQDKADTKPPSATRPRGIRTLSDLNRPAKGGSGSDSDEPQEYYTGGEKSGMLVQDPTKSSDVDSIFSQARQLLSGETVPTAAPQPPEVVIHTITFWRNGFSVDDGPLRRLDDPENAPFLESIKKSECPKELEPANRRTAVHVNLMRREEEYPEPVKRHVSFQGVGRTLGESSSTSAAATSESIAADLPLRAAPLPSMGLTVDQSLPSTSIQLRLADGTRMVSRFNYHHTIRDIHAFIDASRPDGARSYRLQTMGFPPKQLSDLDQTIEQAGIANSVIIQKL